MNQNLALEHKRNIRIKESNKIITGNIQNSGEKKIVF